LAIASLDRVCRENYTVRAQAARFGFEYGIKAKQHFDEYQEAIKILQDMLDKLITATTVRRGSDRRAF